MSRDVERRESGAFGQEVDGGEQVQANDRMQQALAYKRHKKRHAKKGLSEADKLRAAQFKEAMKHKAEGVTTTVAQATTLFQSALLHEKLAPKPYKLTDTLVDYVIGILFKQLGNALSNFVGAGVIGTIVKQSLAIVKSAAKGSHAPGGEMETIDNIVSTANVASDRFVTCFQSLVDTMSIEQAASDMKLLNATKASPGVDDAKEADIEDAGSVEHGVENQFLEAAGAPITGPAEAEAMATVMLREYKVQRVFYFETPAGAAGAVKEVLSDKAPGEISNAEDRTGLSKTINADKYERNRASNVGNGDGGL
jgi:hypothetical protein